MKIRKCVGLNNFIVIKLSISVLIIFFIFMGEIQLPNDDFRVFLSILVILYLWTGTTCTSIVKVFSFQKQSLSYILCILKFLELNNAKLVIFYNKLINRHQTTNQKSINLILITPYRTNSSNFTIS